MRVATWIEHAPARVLIVEDHPLVAAATAELLHRQFPGTDTVVVGSAAAALERATCEDWFRIFVNLSVRGASGLSLLRALSTLDVVRRCCVVNAARDDRVIFEARRMGVLGYIERSCTVEQFCRFIEDIWLGVPVFPPGASEAAAAAPQLTSRQLAVLHLLHKGLSSKQIARELAIAEGTVKNHSLALLRALGASNRAHAVARGLQLGLLEPVAARESA